MTFVKQIIKVILILAFFQGFLETYLNIPPETTKFICEAFILVLWIYVFMFHFAELKLPSLVYFIIFILISVISLLSNHGPLLMLLVFVRRYLLGIVFFYLILNLKLSEKDLLSIWKLIFILFLVQIPIALVKLLTIGAAETPMIGSIANLGGSISTVLPMMATVIFASFYFYYGSKKNLLIILGFLFFGFVGLKRAIAIFLPLTFLFTYITYLILERTKGLSFIFNIKNVVLVLFSLPICFYLLVRLSPSLNKEDKIWGSFDSKFTVEYMQTYETRSDYSEKLANRVQGTGRFTAWQAANTFIQSSSFSPFLGMGPGVIETSSLFNDNDKTLELLSLGYGVSMIGGIRIFLQIGYIGLGIFILFNLNLFLKILKKYKNRDHESKTNVYLLIAICSFFVFFIDILIYSPTIITEPALGFSFYFFAASALKFTSSNKPVLRYKKILERKCR
jgi:hypothetical protein